ncbi:MAG TPA: AMP-binding protein [Propioniciclava sp.]|uniref:AMP-binding protein n=2 Tax=Propioniciclava sp. TaxID=2038686 RepID=UPI002BCB7CF0|nr:AMP-binding protein [Propioniciclava sp.]HRL49698.1 AMP-binding protein [Propioniciclava sp.]
MFAPSWGGGGTGAEAVAALYTHLSAQLRARESHPRHRAPTLLMAPDAPAYADALTRLREADSDAEVIIATSGSTDGRGHLVGLTLDALVASASATLARLGGPCQWVTSLPIHGVAGFQVVLRSALAVLPPVVYAPASGFDAALFEAAVDALTPGRAALSLVPTQLHAALAAGTEALSRFDAVLVGGAALPPDLAARARAAGVRVVRTYGSTETAGGCVYDGVPLDGVSVRIHVDGDAAPPAKAPPEAGFAGAEPAQVGRVLLAGPTLALGYLDAPADAQPFVWQGGRRWLVTPDLGILREGRLEVSGRADDVLLSGGTNVSPLVVEAALSTLGGEWLVVGLPDPHWGQRVTALTTDPDVHLDAARAATASLRPAERPRALLHLDALPLRPTGKPDRRAAAALAQRLAEEGRAETR